MMIRGLYDDARIGDLCPLLCITRVPEKRVDQAHAAVHARDWKLGARHCPSRWIVFVLPCVESRRSLLQQCRRHVHPPVTHTVCSKADGSWSFGSGWTGLSCAGIAKLHCICNN